MTAIMTIEGGGNRFGEAEINSQEEEEGEGGEGREVR
jgi:hypothetical protein